MSLKVRIIAEIGRSGPIPFERFMELALYGEGGFFASDVLRSSKGGDFLTSPEVSSLFGETLARFVECERDRIGEPFDLVEVAAGSGSLLRSITGVLDVPVTAVEVSATARAALGDVVSADRVLERLPESIRGVVLANELLDNLPMALAQRVEGCWRERWVGVGDGGLVFVDAEPRPAVLDWLSSFAGGPSNGDWVEVQLAAAAWLDDVLARVVAGSVVVIDYGDTMENLRPRRKDGTLRTYRAHHLGPHPLDEPGKTDITADVNFTALMDVARGRGAEVELVRQDDFLSRLGLRDRLSGLRRTELEAARVGEEMERLRLRTLRTEAETLMHPRGLGDFRVLCCSVDG